MATQTKPRFPLGRLMATPGALDALEQAGQSPADFLARHVCGDWGDVGAEDAELNEEALQMGNRLLSAYETSRQTKIWIITEWDRSQTTILCPDEY